MYAQYDHDSKKFIVWPVNSIRPFDVHNKPIKQGVDAFTYRKDKEGHVGNMSLH